MGPGVLPSPAEVPRADRSAVIESHLQRWQGRYLVLFTAVFFLSTGFVAARRIFNNDELFTLYVSRLGSVSEICTALLRGADNHPPLDYILRHFSMGVFGYTEFGERFPSLLGFWMFCICLYRFTARSTGAIGGFIALLVPFSTAAYEYSYFGRSYGVQLGFAGLTLVAWQAVHLSVARRRAVVAALAFFVALCGLLTLHYYAILILLPLGAAEAIRPLQKRRPEWKILLATAAAGCCAAAILAPYARYTAKYAQHFATPVRISSVAYTYLELLQTSCLALSGSLFLAAFLIAKKEWGESATPTPMPLRLHEVTFSGVSLLIPLALAILARFVTKAFYPKYALLMVPGFAVLTAFVILWATTERPRLRSAVLFALLISAGYAMGRNAWGYQDDDQVAFIQGTKEAIKSLMIPVVFNHPGKFLVFDYYTRSSDPKARLLVSSDAAVRWTAKDTDDRSVRDLSFLVPGKVEDYADFMRREHTFIVVPPTRWIIPQLLDDGFHVETVRLPGGLIAIQATARTSPGRN